MNPIDRKIIELNELGTHLFIEYYSRTRLDMYKCLNPYTDFPEEKLVFYPIEAGIEKSLKAAVRKIKKRKESYLNNK